MWPPDCPDDIVKSAINKTTELFAQYKEVASDVIKPSNISKIVEELKKYLDETHGGKWHVFMGKNFGCQCVHEFRRFLYFIYETYACLMYKCG